MIFNFKIVEGIVLGVTTALAFAWSQKREYRRAGQLCYLFGGTVLMLFIAQLAIGNAGDATASIKVDMALSWGGATLIWAMLVLLGGFMLARKPGGT